MNIAKRQERKLREKEARKKDILNSAIVVFSEYGFVKTSMDLVATEAVLAVGTLYRYYKSKEELFVSIVFEAIETTHELLEVIEQSDEAPQVKLKRIWDFFYQFHQENPMYYQALLFLHDPSFANAFNETAQGSIGKFTTENFHLLGSVMQEGIDAGVFYSEKPHVLSDFLWSTFVGLVNLVETRKQFGGDKSDLGIAHQETWVMIERAVIKSPALH